MRFERRKLVLLGVFALGVYLLARLGQRLKVDDAVLMAPLAGWALGFFRVADRRRHWPFLTITLLAASLLATLPGRGAGSAIGYALAQLGVAVVGSALLQTVVTARFEDHVSRGIAIVGVAPIAAIAGVAIEAIPGDVPTWRAALSLWVATTLGIVLIALPTIVELRRRRFEWAGGRSAELVPIIALAASIQIVTWSPSLNKALPGVEYLLVPCLVWSALRFSPRITTGVLTSSMLAIAWHTGNDGTSFARSPNPAATFQMYALAIIPCATVGLAVIQMRHLDRARLRRALEDLESSELRFRAEFDLSPNGIAVLDDQERFLRVNGAWCAITGRSRDEYLGRRWDDFVATDNQSFVRELARNLAVTKQLSGEMAFDRPDGATRLVMCSAHDVPMRGASHETVIQLVDLTDRRLIEERLRASEERFRRLTASAPVGIFELDYEARCTYTNGLWHEQWGVPAEQVHGFTWTSYVVEADRERLFAAWRSFRDEGGEVLDIEFAIEVPQHGQRLVHARITPLLRGDGGHARTDGFVGTIEDITVVRTAQAELAHRASHDPLTELANRALLDRQLQEACGTTERLAMLVIDLDGFKEVNDNLGHEVGDQLLRYVARQLLRSVRRHDIVARLGGDEFAVLLRDLHRDDEAELIGNRMLEAISLPTDLDGTLVAVRGSIGVALAHGGSEEARTLLRDADVAMYAAKARGKGVVTMFAPELRRLTMERHELRIDLTNAAFDDELQLVHQPVFDLSAGALVGTEALLRWHHPQRGPVGPGEFIDLAEESGIINRLGLWVINRAVDEVSEWRRSHPGLGLDLSINLSPRQLADPELSTQLLTILDRADLRPESFMVELVEGDLLGAVDGALDALDTLRRWGVRVALDDYGSGHASIAFLRRLPIDMLKLDHTLVAALDNDPAQGTVYVRSLLELSKSLGLKVVAEGIESPTQLDKLIELGCDLGQGYLLGEPVAIADLAPAHAVLHRHDGLAHP